MQSEFVRFVQVTPSINRSIGLDLVCISKLPCEVEFSQAHEVVRPNQIPIKDLQQREILSAAE